VFSMSWKPDELEEPPPAIEWEVNIIVPVNAKSPKAMYCDGCLRRGRSNPLALIRKTT